MQLATLEVVFKLLENTEIKCKYRCCSPKQSFTACSLPIHCSHYFYYFLIYLYIGKLVNSQQMKLLLFLAASDLYRYAFYTDFFFYVKRNFIVAQIELRCDFDIITYCTIIFYTCIIIFANRSVFNIIVCFVRFRAICVNRKIHWTINWHSWNAVTLANGAMTCSGSSYSLITMHQQ